jgi:hypothetical protein
MTFQHAVLWMDHELAIILWLGPTDTQRILVHNQHRHLHANPDCLGSRMERDRLYFTAVSQALGDVPEILLLGPGQERADFGAWMKAHHPRRADHILHSTPWQRASDGELVAEGRRFFKAADRMRPQPHP